MVSSTCPVRRGDLVCIRKSTSVWHLGTFGRFEYCQATTTEDMVGRITGTVGEFPYTVPAPSAKVQTTWSVLELPGRNEYGDPKRIVLNFGLPEMCSGSS